MSFSCHVQHPPRLEPTARLAVAELQAYLPRLTGGRVHGAPSLRASNLLIIRTEKTGTLPGRLLGELKRVQHDGYLLWPLGKAGVALAARNAKGLLNAVYGYLGWLGVLWPSPDAETLPSRGPLAFPSTPILRNPSCRRRGIEHSVGDPLPWLKWYARQGFNEAMLHQPPGLWKDTAKAADELGIVLQTGGHGLSSLLSRKLFDQHPDYFRALQPPDFERRRLSDSNLCSGNPKALAIVKANTRRFVRQFPASVYHLWADDLPAGGWCYCARCWGYPPQDQALRAMNAVAEAVVEVNPKARLAHCIYHDTFVPPRAIRAHPAIEPLVAPRERCYAHAINDPRCARNRSYCRNLEAILERFDRRGWSLFEYYSDYILFRAMLPLFPEIIAEDLKYYHSLGMDCAQHLLVGTVVGVLTNLHVFAQQVWDLKADPWKPLQRLAQGQPGLLKAWKLQAQASRRWLKICDWPQDRYYDYRFLIELPEKQAREYGAGLRRAEGELGQAVAALPRTLPAWAEPERLALRTSLGIVRQMQPQTAMLQALGECANGANRWKEAKQQARRATQRGQDVGRIFRQAGMKQGYFFGLEKLLEQLWKDRISAAP